MASGRGGRPRDAHLHATILAAARELVVGGGYAELAMESVAARAGVSKKTLYRRWPSKADLVAEAVLDAYGRGGSFAVADTGDLRADLKVWLTEHAEFIADPVNAGLIRALIAAAAASPMDTEALYEQLSAPQQAGLVTRLRQAIAAGHIGAGTDCVAVADAMIGSLLLQVLARTTHPAGSQISVGTVVDVLLDGVATPLSAPDNGTAARTR
ncbi:TetR/AcrR family transcriptional regulator [Mycobacterium sp. pUA109]|uniref:TetR/AcrR family transcriptional regulator n=1 Tax=Mycobacterium sp. pUA109 TaxID=3238982 RepID=UPI00351BCE4E